MNTNNYQNEIDKAYTAFKNKQYKEALKFLNNAVKIDKNRFSAYYYSGIVYNRQKEYKTAVKYIKQIYEYIKGRIDE